MNAENYLYTPTYDGSGHTVHPDILYFPESWNGHKYWMAMTPYKSGNDDYENPSLLVSENGSDWSVPEGLTNPLVTMPTAPGWNNDPEITVVRDTMFYYFNESNVDSNTYLKRMFSTDGIHWSLPVTAFHFPWHLMSPSILFENNTYYLWYLRSKGCYDNKSTMYLRQSSDGLNWSPEVAVNVSLPGIIVWHINICKEDDKYIMLLSSYPESVSDCAKTNLYYAESTDMINWTVNPQAILIPAFNRWDSFNIYRCSFLIEHSFLKIWYSSRDKNRNWHIGYTEGYLQEFLAPNKWSFTSGDVRATGQNHKNGTRSITLAGSNTPTRIAKYYNNPKSFNVWVYDNGDTTSGYSGLLRIFDNYSTHTIGVGFAAAQSKEYYVYHPSTAQFIISSIRRTAGWHKLEIKVASDASNIFIDDQFIASISILNASKLTKFHLEGGSVDTTFFDDCYLRDFASQEPLVTASPTDTLSAMSAIQIKVFLEGAYSTELKCMHDKLHDYIPRTSPYEENIRTISSIPDSVTDWILVQFKTDSSSAPVYSLSALLRKNGFIVNDTASSEILDLNLPPGKYYIVIRHRNHIPIMSSHPVEISSVSELYDFSSSAENIYGGTRAAVKLIDIYAMIAGDCNGDGSVTGSDFNSFNPQYTIASEGYNNTDINLDSKVTGTDFNLFLQHFVEAASSAVP